MVKDNKDNKENKGIMKMNKRKFKPLRALFHRYSAQEVKSMKLIIKKEIFDLSKNFKTNKIPEGLLAPEDQKYFVDYKTYVNEQFSQRIANMAIKYVKNSKTIPNNLKDDEENFISKFIDLIKRLLMSELEVAFFTLLIDEKGCKYKNFNFWRILKFYGLATKTFYGNHNLVMYIFSKKPELDDDYHTWLNCKENTNILKQTNKRMSDINNRHKELTKIMNSYCSKDYINLNGVVDQIIKLSQPYRSTQFEGKGMIKTNYINDNNIISINNINNICSSNNINNLNKLKIKDKLSTYPFNISIVNASNTLLQNSLLSNSPQKTICSFLHPNLQNPNSKNLILTPKNSQALSEFNKTENNNNKNYFHTIDPFNGIGQNLNEDSQYFKQETNCIFNQISNNSLALFYNNMSSNINPNISFTSKEPSFLKNK